MSGQAGGPSIALEEKRGLYGIPYTICTIHCIPATILIYCRSASTSARVYMGIDFCVLHDVSICHRVACTIRCINFPQVHSAHPCVDKSPAFVKIGTADQEVDPYADLPDLLRLCIKLLAVHVRFQRLIAETFPQNLLSVVRVVFLAGFADMQGVHLDLKNQVGRICLGPVAGHP